MNTTETKKLTFRTTHPKANRKVVAAVLSAAISLGTLGLSASPAHSLWCRPNDPRPICKPSSGWFVTPPAPPAPTIDVRHD